jgi:hypothetical protein
MGSSDYYKHGDRNAICDMCGFKYKLSSLRKRWDGLLVCSKDFEPQHPQSLIQINSERPRWVECRPETTDVFITDTQYVLLEDGEYLVLEDGTRLLLG